MKELEYLAKQAKYALIAPSPKQAISAKPETILAIAEAFGALEQEVKKNLEGALAWQQRAEAAEAKLAELEKQEPVAFTEECEIKNMQATGLYLRGFPDNSSGRNIELFTSPAPAVSLAELVPDGWKLVPVEPTTEMLEEIWLDERFKEVAMKRRYQALLAAAPTPHE